MKKILLTSTGFDNENIKNKFLTLLDKDVSNTQVLFVITAADDADSVRVLSGCLDDLTNCGIKDANITVYDMHKLISLDDIKKYDVMYVCGGSTKKLVDRIIELNFKKVCDELINNSGIYIGVSAGSIVASGTYKNSLNLIDNKLDVHCEKGSSNGIISTHDEIYLTDSQAIYISDKESIIFE